MKITSNFGKRIILSLIVVMLLSLVVGSVFVYSIDEKKIRLDELSAIKKLVLAERDRSFNIVKAKIERLLSETTPDGTKKDATTIEKEKELAQKFIDALREADFLTDVQRDQLNENEKKINAGKAEEKSTWSSKWIWILLALLLLFGGAAFTKKGRNAYGFGGRLTKLGFSRFWFMVSGKKGKLEAIDRYNKQMEELDSKIRNVITKEILGHLIEKEKLIIANFKDANQLLLLGNLIRNSLFKKGSPFVKSHALDLLVHYKTVIIEGIGEVKPIKLKEILDQIKDINDKLPPALNQLISHEISILVQHRNFLQNARQIILKANAAGARLSDKPVKRLLATKTAEIDAIINRIDEAVKKLDLVVNTLNRTVGILDKILAEQNEYIKLEIGINDPEHKEASYGGFTELLDIIDKRFDQFANVAQDILDEADKIKNSFVTREKITYDAIDKIVEKLKQESDKIVEINKTIKLDELNNLIDAARKISYLISKLNQNKTANRNKVTANDFMQFIKLVEKLKQYVPQVTLEEFKEQLEGFVIVHENGEFKILEVSGDNARLENVTRVITFEQLKNIDKFLDNINRDRATSLIQEIIRRTKADTDRYNEVQSKKEYEKEDPLYADPNVLPYKPLKDLIAHYTTEVLGNNQADRDLLLRLMVEYKKKQRGNTPKEQDFQIACEIFEGYKYTFGHEDAEYKKDLQEIFRVVLEAKDRKKIETAACHTKEEYGYFSVVFAFGIFTDTKGKSDREIEEIAKKVKVEKQLRIRKEELPAQLESLIKSVAEANKQKKRKSIAWEIIHSRNKKQLEDLSDKFNNRLREISIELSDDDLIAQVGEYIGDEIDVAVFSEEEESTALVPIAKKGKIAVISDVHSNLQAFQAVLTDIKNQGITEIYCCGDIIGYNANPNECVKLIKDQGIKWVLGNHEVAILNPGYAKRKGFNASATAVVNWQIKELNQDSKEFLNAQTQRNYILAQDDFVIVHSELTKAKDFWYLDKDWCGNSSIDFDRLLADNFGLLKKYKKRVCFIGHVHMPEIWTIDAKDKVEGGYIDVPDKEGIVDITNAKNAIVNVGSVGQPRDKNNKACYVIYDKEDSKIIVKYVRIEYDIKAAQKAIRDRIPDGYDKNAANAMANRLAQGE